MFNMTDTQQVVLTVAFLDKKGNPAVVQGPPTWASSDPTIVAVTPSADGLSATAVAAGPEGQATVTVTGDADPGDGVVNVTGTLDITIGPSQAVNVGITPGAPTEQP
jgi:hypothetical protein